MHCHANFRADTSSRCREMAVFLFFMMVAVHHLQFLKVRKYSCQNG